MTFDSNTATGGVCLGFVTIPAFTSVTKTYPEFGPGRTGFTVNDLAGSTALDSFTYDNSLGYPRFTFGSAAYDRSFLLFIK